MLIKFKIQLRRNKKDYSPLSKFISAEPSIRYQFYKLRPSWYKMLYKGCYVELTGIRRIGYIRK